MAPTRITYTVYLTLTVDVDGTRRLRMYTDERLSEIDGRNRYQYVLATARGPSIEHCRSKLLEMVAEGITIAPAPRRRA